MVGIILIVGLIITGIVTDNSVYYWIAAVLSALFISLYLIALSSMRRTKRELDDLFNKWF